MTERDSGALAGWKTEKGIPKLGFVLELGTQPLIQEFNQLMAESVELEHAVTLEFIYHTPARGVSA